jgi:hypothetical protein
MKLAHVVIVFLLAAIPSWTVETGKAFLVRKFKENSAALVGISKDGRFILTIGHGKGRNCSGCRISILAVYETSNGRKVSEVATKDSRDEYFSAAAFSNSQHICALKQNLSGPNDSRLVMMDWDFISGTHIAQPLHISDDFDPMCIFNDSRTVGILRNNKSRPSQQNLAISDAAGLHILGQPFSETPFPFEKMVKFSRLNCSIWETGNNLLFGTAGPDSALYWTSTQVDRKPTLCYTFPGEIIRGFTFSPDRSLLAVITTSPDIYEDKKYPPITQVFLTVLQGKSCELLRRIRLPFPDIQPVWRAPLLAPNNKYLDNHLFKDQLASSMAISPDNTKLALAYGIYKSSDGIAFFGLFSLSDGSRLATLRGDIYRGGIFQGFIRDQLWVGMAPIRGEMRFSPDSRTLFATSECIWQWDLSGLR